MKIFSLAFLNFLIIGLLFSCEKNSCLDPTPIPAQKDTVYVDTPPPTQSFTNSMKSGAANDVDALLVFNSTTSGNVSYPAHPTIYAEAWTNFGLQLCRSIIDFPLTSIPSGATVTKATLTLYADTTNPVAPKFGHYSSAAAPNDWVIKKVITPWNKSTVTWNNQPSTNNVDTLLMSASNYGYQRYDVDITKFIQERYANPSSHYGYLIKLNDETIYRSLAFCSSNHQHQQLTPELKVEYQK